MLRNRLLVKSAMVLVSLAAGFYSCGWYLNRNDIDFLEPYSYCSLHSYLTDTSAAGFIKTKKYLQGMTFKQAEALIASKLPTWQHRHFMKDLSKFKLNRIEDAYFAPAGKYWPIVELGEIQKPDGERYVVVTESRKLNAVDLAIARITTLGVDPIDGSDLHMTKMQRKPYRDFPRGLSWILDRKLGYQP